ncbi:MAG: hypothetical protein HY908_20890 [Myxococcales bacterium]|nr:hypothetical protein [Myxococcales bacterium]
MMRAPALLSAVAALGVTVFAADALADSLDPALNRLVLDRRCLDSGPSGGAFYNPASGYRRCNPNDEAFAKLIAQYGAALAPTADYAARTTGYGGFKLAIEADYTTIDHNASYWQEGTEGPRDKSTGQASVRNLDPPSVIQTYAIKLAKGFPFGLELGGTFGWLAGSNIVSGGADVRFAVFEGFRDSVPGFIPDIGVAGGVRTITGTSQFKLTVASFDAQLSKPIHIAGSVILQPHVGYQWVRIFGDSDLVDLTPNTDPIQHCGYTGENTPATPDPDKQVLDGQPVCAGSSADFNNSVVFDPIRLTRHRINFGAQLRYQMVYLGVHALTDVISPQEANKNADYQVGAQAGTRNVLDPTDPSNTRRIPNVPVFGDDPRTPDNDAVGKQWTVAIDVGAVF